MVRRRGIIPARSHPPLCSIPTLAFVSAALSVMASSRRTEPTSAPILTAVRYSPPVSGASSLSVVPQRPVALLRSDVPGRGFETGGTGERHPRLPAFPLAHTQSMVFGDQVEVTNLRCEGLRNPDSARSFKRESLRFCIRRGSQTAKNLKVRNVSHTVIANPRSAMNKTRAR